MAAMMWITIIFNSGHCALIILSVYTLGRVLQLHKFDRDLFMAMV